MGQRAADEGDVLQTRRRMSATNWPRPRIKRSSSLRNSRAPTPCPVPAAPRRRRVCRHQRFVPLAAWFIRSKRPRRAAGSARWRRDAPGAQAERRLQQAVGDHFGLFVVAQNVAAGLLVSTVTSASMPGRSAPIASDKPEHLGRVRGHHRHHLLERQAQRHHRTHRLHQAELGLARERMILVIGVLRQGVPAGAGTWVL
jgi:hypothetical protein